jgi:hypothetical protein
LPHLEALYTSYTGSDVDIIVVDASNREEMTRDVASEISLSLPVLLDDKDVSHDKYELYATPTTLIVDSRGRIVFKHVGFAEGMEGTLKREIELLLQREPT